MLRAHLEESSRRQRALRDQLGKSELARQRESTEFQAELTKASKRLRASKNQNEQLARKFQEVAQHHPHHHHHHQPPPPAPPVFQHRSMGHVMFGEVGR